ncbi:MAG: sugar transferase [Patescibacteria group bacterium]
MKVNSQREVITLFLGDIIALLTALWVSLLVRYLELPTNQLFSTHLIPFVLIFLVWVLVFFIFDLYGKQTSIFQKKLSKTILNAQALNSLLAIIFFYFIPYFGITPKITLFIDLGFSFTFILIWRIYLSRLFYRGRKETVLFLCHGKEVNELLEEFKTNPKYNVRALELSARQRPDEIRPSIVVINTYDRHIDESLGDYYQMIFQGVHFVNAHNLYEDVFDRVPIGLINERWFLENISSQPKVIYDSGKRIFDIITSLILGLVSLVFYPLVWLLIKLDDGGPVFFTQERTGKNDQVFKIYKFRSMRNDQVTRIGKLLRQGRLDELPQLWSVLIGDQSMVGPRPEKPDYAQTYRHNIPYYDVRHLISPGLSGWAQIYQENHPHFSLGPEQTMEKLSYDLYYVKNRNWWLDLKITLKTLNILLRRTGI